MYALQKPLKEELERLQKQQVVLPLGIDEALEWSKSFVLVVKVNGKGQLCMDLARLDKALI